MRKDTSVAFASFFAIAACVLATTVNGGDTLKAAASNPTSSPPGFAQWSNREGRTATLKFLSHDKPQGLVRFLAPSGQKYTVALSSLSDRDRRRVEVASQGVSPVTSNVHLVSQDIEGSTVDDLGAVVKAKPTDAMRARFLQHREALLAQVEESRRERENVEVVREIREPKDVVKECWRRVRCGLFRHRWVRSRVVVREYRSTTVREVSERGLEWDDSRVGVTDLNDTTIRFTDLPPTTGARLDFIRGLLRDNAIGAIEEEIPLRTNLAVAMVTEWQSQSDGINERQYFYQGSIVTDAADRISFEVKVKERPIGFNQNEDYIPVSNEEATAEFKRLAAAIGLPGEPENSEDDTSA